MPYNPLIAERIRTALADEPSVTERKMFGGVGFMVEGAMAIAASSDGGVLARVDPTDAERLIGHGVEPMIMRGREMRGWLLVAPDAVSTDAELAAWVARGVAFVRISDSAESG